MEGRLVPNVVLAQSSWLSWPHRVVGQCQAAIAEAVEAFGRVDVLLGSTSEGKHTVRTAATPSN